MSTSEIENKDNKQSDEDELTRLNKLFANRYTDQDEEYIKMAKPRSNTPPIVDNWSPQRNTYRNQQRYNSNDRGQQRYNANDRSQQRYDSNDRNNNGNNYHRYDRRNYENRSYDNRYPRDRSRSPPRHHERRR